MSNMQRFRDGIEAVNDRDWDRHRQLLAPDVMYIDYGSGLTQRGATEFVEWQRAGMEPFPDEKLRIISIAESGSTVLAEMTAEGTHTAPLPLPTGGAIAATNKPFTVHVTAVCEYDADGRTTSCRIYSNPMEMMQQLGIAPMIPAQISLDQPSPVKS